MATERERILNVIEGLLESTSQIPAPSPSLSKIRRLEMILQSQVNLSFFVDYLSLH